MIYGPFHEKGTWIFRVFSEFFSTGAWVAVFLGIYLGVPVCKNGVTSVTLSRGIPYVQSSLGFGTTHNPILKVSTTASAVEMKLDTIVHNIN